MVTAGGSETVKAPKVLGPACVLRLFLSNPGPLS